MKTYWIVLPHCTSFKKHQAFFIKGAPNPGPQDRVPETRAPAKFYVTSWLQFVVFVDNITWRYGRENPQTKRFLVQFKKNAYTVVN